MGEPQYNQSTVDIDHIAGGIPSLSELARATGADLILLGSRAYYLHSILHDWPDDVCHQILAPLKAAMVPGISRLLTEAGFRVVKIWTADRWSESLIEYVV
ncbi:uncharacterized protein BO80DRAFT_442634 [Aspergillus ibericus CBS 121593]|uniref:S-adenosyl-L-methionine-dependent methyltransferase n=1 Tax=Aspergillus ibericus CBS 121593 TaxID=1448316 RepID=A0A395H7M8_9EURO|nr:hypothetical protein BO80DRAFT_442634 [Aspergillus ibericus CBS 121593]RAL03513.1 hypothetical protein BO80DRAFT_442634 [Aspergillus ibericus CBS 121593]